MRGRHAAIEKPAPSRAMSALPPFTSHFAALAPGYDVVLSDVWGVVHNGVAATPEACDALAHIRAARGTVVLITKAPRPGRGVVRTKLQRLKEARPDLRLLWLPFWILRMLSAALWAFLKLARPKSPALNLYSAFKSERYDDTISRQFTGARE